MPWSSWIRDFLLLILGGFGSAIWFFLRRKAEQAPVFETIQKTEKLLSLQKELDNTNYSLQDLKSLEDALMGRAKTARILSKTFELEAQQVREIEMSLDMTQTEMNIAASQAYQKAERRLDLVVDKLKLYFAPDELAEFDRVNNAWRDYQIKHAKFNASRYQGGSIHSLIYASTLEGITVARIVELESELRHLQETSSPYQEQTNG